MITNPQHSCNSYYTVGHYQAFKKTTPVATLSYIQATGDTSANTDAVSGNITRGYDSKSHFESGSNANLTVYSGYSSHNEYFIGDRSQTLTANNSWSQVNGGVPFGTSFGSLVAVRNYRGGTSEIWNGYGGFASTYCGTESQSWNDPSIASYDARNLTGTRFTPHDPPGVPAPYSFNTPNMKFVMPPALVEDTEAAAAGQEQTWSEWAVDQGIGFIPVIGSARDAYRAYMQGDNLSLVLNVGMLGVDLLTLGGASVAKGVVKSSLKAEKSLMKLGGKALKSKGDDALKLVDNKIDDVGRSLIDDAAGGAKGIVDDVVELPGSAAFKNEKNRNVAEYLEQFGRKVKLNPLEGVPGAGRQGDAFVDGVKHEFKTLDPGATSSTIKNQVSSSIKSGGQARNIVIDARNSGLSKAEAIRSFVRIQNIYRGRLDNLTIIGNDFFMNHAFGGL